MRGNVLVALLFMFVSVAMAEDRPDPERDILVTLVDAGGFKATAGGAPYRFRKRYAISPEVKDHARAISRQYSLHEVDDWPIRSLSVYCIVYRVPEGADRQALVAALERDERVDSAQLLNTFETGTSSSTAYDDTYANYQHGLDQLGVSAAHDYSRGAGVRVAIVDSHVDIDHEDLAGRVHRVTEHVDSDVRSDRAHGTAVVSVIGAMANNALGIVGVAPEATLELHVACWLRSEGGRSVCDSFSLARALDAIVDDAPDVLNLSLTGPADPLLGRLLDRVAEQNTVIVAAERESPGPAFPASHRGSISVASGDTPHAQATYVDRALFAPGRQIMVAVPDGNYDFRSGTSIAAAHVSGVAALVLGAAPDLEPARILQLLKESQVETADARKSVDACRALQPIAAGIICSSDSGEALVSKLESDT